MTLFDINKAEAASKAVELYRDQRPSSSGSAKLTLRQCAEKCGAHYSLVRKYNARYQKGERIPGFHKPGRQPALDDGEEDALAHFVRIVRRGLFPVTSAALISYGDFLRARRPCLRRRRRPSSSPPVPLTYRWAIKWKRDNPQQADGVDDWIRAYADVLETFCVRPEDLWNFDESPFFVGVLDGALRVLVVRNKKKRPRVLFSPDGREGLKVVDCVSAVGGVIPSFLIFRDEILCEDAEGGDVSGDVSGREDEVVVVKKTSSRYYNADIALDWLRHFNTHSFAASTSFHGGSSSLADWFGYPASIDPSHGDPRAGGGGGGKTHRRRDEDAIYRVLLMDGFNAHEKPAVLLYCEYFDIIAVSLPSPTSGRQPFDAGLYKLVKAAQRGSLHRAVLQQETEARQIFPLRDILAEFAPLRDAVFNDTARVCEAFRDAGLWPVDIGEEKKEEEEEEIPQFKTVEGSFYLVHDGRADSLVTDPVLEARLAAVTRWRRCRTDAERWEVVAGEMVGIPEVAEWVRARRGEGGSVEEEGEGEGEEGEEDVCWGGEGSDIRG